MPKAHKHIFKLLSIGWVSKNWFHAIKGSKVNIMKNKIRNFLKIVIAVVCFIIGVYVICMKILH